MKKITLLLMCGLLACGSLAAQNVKYEISGKTSDKSKEGKTVYLSLYSQSRKAIDSAIVTNGAFAMKGTLPAKDVAILRFKDGAAHSSFVLEGVPVNVELAEKNFPFVNGGEMAALYNEYQQSMRDIYKKLEDLNFEDLMTEYNKKETTDARRDEIRKIYDETYETPVSQLSEKMIDDNLDNIIGAVIFYSTQLEDDKCIDILSKAGPDFKNYPPVQRIQKRFDAIALTSAGKQFVDFELADPEGKMHKLSEYAGKGNYVLVDFWASWCGPCRGEMPNFVKLYAEYHQKGFEIVGVSLDKDKDAWVNGIAKLGITWPQISDIKYWDCVPAKTYGVNSIPATVLIGPDGKIIARNLRGEELANKLAEIYAGK